MGSRFCYLLYNKQKNTLFKFRILINKFNEPCTIWKLYRNNNSFKIFLFSYPVKHVRLSCYYSHVFFSWVTNATCHFSSSRNFLVLFLTDPHKWLLPVCFSSFPEKTLNFVFKSSQQLSNPCKVKNGAYYVSRSWI